MSSRIPRPTVPGPALPHQNFSPIMMFTQNMWKTDFALLDIICYDIGYDITFCTTWWAIIGDSQTLLGYFSFETMSNVCLRGNT